MCPTLFFPPRLVLHHFSPPFHHLLLMHGLRRVPQSLPSLSRVVSRLVLFTSSSSFSTARTASRSSLASSSTSSSHSTTTAATPTRVSTPTPSPSTQRSTSQPAPATSPASTTLRFSSGSRTAPSHPPHTFRSSSPSTTTSFAFRVEWEVK